MEDANTESLEKAKEIMRNWVSDGHSEKTESQIRSLEIDFDNDVLKINGKEVKDKQIRVEMPGPELPGLEGWPISMVFNIQNPPLMREQCDLIKVTYTRANNKP